MARKTGKKKRSSAKKRVQRNTVTQPVSVESSASATTTSMAPDLPAVIAKPRTAATVSDKQPYVVSDIHRIATLAVSFVGLQLLLWYLMSQTSFGNQVYNLVKF
jgi:hypothetical protein